MSSQDTIPDSARWKETSPGVYTRPFGFYDKFMLNFERKGASINQDSWTIVSRLEIKLLAQWSESELISRMRNAWRAVRYYYPMHGMVPDRDTETAVYKVPSDATVEMWLDETFLVKHDMTASEIFEIVAQESGPRMYFLPKTNELIYTVTHWWQDAFGNIAVWKAFFTFLDEEPHPSFDGSEVKHLTPSSEFIIGCPMEVTPARAEMAQKVMSAIPAALGTTVEFACPDKGTTPGKTKRKYMRFERDTTGKIIAACKKHGFSVTSALHASMVDAMFKHPDAIATEHNSYGTVTPQNFREHIDPRIKEAYPVCNLIHGVVMHIARKDFMSMARECGAFYKRGFRYGDIDLAECLVPYLTELVKMTSTTDGPPIANSAGISSFGLLDKKLPHKYQSVEIDDFWLGIRTVDPQANMHLQTFNGKLGIHCSYNEAYLTDGQVDAFFRLWRESLLTGLEIQE